MTLSPWIKLLAGVLSLSLAAWLFSSAQSDAYEKGHAKAKSDGEAALEKLRGEHIQLDLERAQASEASAKAAAKKLLDAQARNDKLAADLARQQRTHRTITDRLTGEIARVNDLYRDALDAPPKPLPACVFTVGWLRLYNEATGATVSATPDTGRTSAQIAEAHATEQFDSGISQRALLAHHVSYAEQCRNTAAQLDLLIDAVQGE